MKPLRGMLELDRCPRYQCGGTLIVEDNELKCLLCARVARNGMGDLPRCLLEFSLLMKLPDIRAELREHRR